MARGCGNNSIELWYYGRGNISEVTIPVTYAIGGAYQPGSTIVIGVGTTWTSAMVGLTLDLIEDDGTIKSAGKIIGFTDTTHLTVSFAQTVASSGDPISYVIKDRGTYALSESVNLSPVEIGIGKGAAFKVNLRPKYTTAGIVSSELDSVDILGGGLNYNTQLFVDESGSGSNFLTTIAPKPALGGSAESTTIHGELSFTVNDSSMWHQAKTFEGTNSVVTTEIEYMFNAITHASVTLVNRPANISSLFSMQDSSGQYTDFFHEGQEILLRDHTTHIVLFRGSIQELEDTFEMGMGQVIQLHAADRMKEWDDIPAEVFKRTAKTVDLPSAKIYSIIENRIGPYQTVGAGDRRIAFGEGPEYKLNSTPTGAVFPTEEIIGAEEEWAGVQEGKIAAKRGYGHQVGRRFAFENSWFPRDPANFSEDNLTVGEADVITNERDQVGTTTFNKGNQKILSAIQNLAAQEPHGEYRRTDGEYINLDGTESEWAFHLSPNILSPTPEVLGDNITTDGQNDGWITNNPRVFTPSIVSEGFIGISDVTGGKGFYPSDVGKLVNRGSTSTTITSTSEDHTRLYTIDTVNWGAESGDVTIFENLDSIPQFNYFEVGSRPAFSFGKDELSNFAVSEQDVRKHSVTMLSPKEPVEEQGLRAGRATASQQSGDRITQPALVGTGTVQAHVKIKDGTAYPLKVPVDWEIKIFNDGSDNPTQFAYRYAFAGTDITNEKFTALEAIADYDNATAFYDLLFNIQLRFDLLGGTVVAVAGDSYYFHTYPQFDNTRALKLMGQQAVFSKYNHEKYSNALVYYDAEAVSDEGYGSSARLEANLVYGWGVQNRSWIFHTSANKESEYYTGTATTDYIVRVHHGDKFEGASGKAHHATPVAGDMDECINYSGANTPITNINDFTDAGGTSGNAFERPLLFGTTLRDNRSWWDELINKDGTLEYLYRDFYWRDKQLTEGEWAYMDTDDAGGASRGGRASEYLDLYRGRYSVQEINSGGETALQIEWRRWDSGIEVAAVQYVSVPARQDTSVNSLIGGVHPPSKGGSTKFPFAAGPNETEMVQMLISFERGKTKGQPEESGGEGTWPTTNTYDENGEPQRSGVWRDFPFVRLVGRTTGTKFDFDADMGRRKDRPVWQGRPIDTWQALRPLRKTYQKDHARDMIRQDLVTALHRRTADMRIGKFATSKAPYYWLEAQVDGFTESGSNNYGDDDIDPSTATTNPNATKTIRFKLQHLGATTGTKYYNPLQYGLMIGNIVRFYNYEVGADGAVTDQNFRDDSEFCYGVITDIQPITTSPQYYTGTAAQNNGSSSAGTVVTGSETTWTADMVGGIFRWEGYPTAGEITGFTSGTVMAVTNTQLVPAGTKYVINKQNEDTFDMCGWIEVELTHVYRKSGATDASVTDAPAMMDAAGSVTYNKVTAQATAAGNYDEGVTTFTTTLNDPDGIDASVTSITAAANHNISPFDIIKLGTEKMLVTNVNGNVLTVERDYDGTTAATHLETASITLVGRAYGGPTRVRVYNMLYPGYAVFAEDISNGISAKHVIEGMRLNSRQGILETEYHTSGKKTDHTIKKWGTTPLHPRTDRGQALVKKIVEVDERSNLGVGKNNFNPVDGLNASTDFYINSPGGEPSQVIFGYTGNDFRV